MSIVAIHSFTHTSQRTRLYSLSPKHWKKTRVPLYIATLESCTLLSHCLLSYLFPPPPLSSYINRVTEITLWLSVYTYRIDGFGWSRFGLCLHCSFSFISWDQARTASHCCVGTAVVLLCMSKCVYVYHNEACVSLALCSIPRYGSDLQWHGYCLSHSPWDGARWRGSVDQLPPLFMCLCYNVSSKALHVEKSEISIYSKVSVMKWNKWTIIYTSIRRSTQWGYNIEICSKLNIFTMHNINS